ncbi:MAG: Smr/MutS family protein [Bacteroidales bacterium]|jgi:DNA mismatch repair protein MutS2|nr:Smr/MutS family protein [Bacteroidales bacterium]
MYKIYPENFESKIGFDTIRTMMQNKCLSVMGCEWVDAMHFHDSYRAIEQQLGETDEFCRIVREFDNFPSGHFYDLRNALKKIRIEGMFLETTELFDLKRSLESIRAIVFFFNKQDDKVFPLLKQKTSPVQVFPYIYGRIDQILNKFGDIRNNASPELAQIRKNIISLQANVSKKLHAILKQAQKDGLVEDDATISVRDGRLVIPVSASNKRKLKGIIYDESATGKTSYIEPNEIVEINNEIREFEYAERREIVKILTDFSNDIRPYIDDLLYSYHFLGEIDFIRSKSLLAIEFNAIKPNFYNEPVIDWINSIHPLLSISLKRENKKVVPLNIKLNAGKHILLISGPNAGGKSVCLKTIGLLQYMLQCGLLIPIDENSRTGVFGQIFIDIGDEQSIENNLSTYSSHLMNMKHFIKFSNEKTLILIDEFGTGTEPMLGGAIAEAILNRLNMQHTFGVITTHYTNLKHFASSAEGIENGAMLYDSQNMSPLFELEIGKPGSSFAFEIARKIGLPEEILEKAMEKVGKKHIDFDRSLRQISRDKRYWESKRNKIRQTEKILDDIAENYEKELIETKKLKNEIIAKAKEEAETILAGVNKRIENTIFEIRNSQAEKEKVKNARQELEQLKLQINTPDNDKSISDKIEKLRQREQKRTQYRSGNTKKNTPAETSEKPAELKPGDKVIIKGQTAIGDLIELNAKNAVIAFGRLITTLPHGRIERLSNNEAKNIEKSKRRITSSFTQNSIQRRLMFKPEIDIRGQRVEEAITKIQKFIDEAIMFKENRLRILHGKGNGILKEAIREYLRTEAMVSSCKDEHVDFGGAGITVVVLSL